MEDAFLAVNGLTTQGVFFRETVFLNMNEDYEYGAWVCNASIGGGGLPEIGIRIKGINNVTIHEFSTGVFSFWG